MEELKDNKKGGNYEILNTTSDTIDYNQNNVIESALNVDLDINKDIIIENTDVIDYSNDNIKKIKLEDKNDIELYSCRDNNKLTIEKEDLINNYNLILNFKKREKFSFSKIGNMYCFWFDDEGIPKIAIGPHCKIFFI